MKKTEYLKISQIQWQMDDIPIERLGYPCSNEAKKKPAFK